jgi:hypothetical protein
MSKQPAVHNLFGDDSDDEGGPTTRPRSGAAGPATTGCEPAVSHHCCFSTHAAQHACFLLYARLLELRTHT